MSDDGKRKKINFTTLQAVTEVLKCRSITKAANKLNMSQPAMSAHLRRFEESLGYLPIRRVGNEMVVTSSDSIRIIDQILALENDLVNVGRNDRSRMPKLGVCTYFGDFLVNGFDKSDYFYKNFSLYLDCSTALADMFSYGNLDIMIRPLLNGEDSEYFSIHSLVWAGNFDFDSLPSTEPRRVILGRPNSPLGILVRGWLKRNRVPYLVVMESEDPTIVLNMCRNLNAVAPIPEYLLCKYKFPFIGKTTTTLDPLEVSIGLFSSGRNTSYFEVEHCFENFQRAIEVDSVGHSTVLRHVS